jgi:homogentisate phytyltransferase / homogentisate geranylgeranyltransferase
MGGVSRVESGPPVDAGRVRSALLGFSRPHTIIGTTVSVCALFAVARSLPTEVQPGTAHLVTALVAGLAVNVYIVGLNQLTDVELDRINKPWLPLPAGQLSPRTARRLVAGSLVVGVAAGAAGGWWLLGAIVVAAALGTAYSVPPLRLKRHHALAAGCIVGVRGLVVNLGVYAHFAVPAGQPLRVPATVAVLTGAVVVTGLVIAWFKDLTDMDGDRRHAVGTLPLRLGAPRVVALGAGALLVTYAAVVALALTGLSGTDVATLALGHLALAGMLTRGLVRLDTGDARSTARFYRGIWSLFYAEYAVFTVAVVLA